MRRVLLRAALRDAGDVLQDDGPDPLRRDLRLAAVWTLDAWEEAWFEACAGVKCEGLQAGFANSLKILFPSLALSIAVSSVTGYALALWNVRWANTFLFLLFICAFVPFQIIMIPLILLSWDDRCLWQHARHSDRPRRFSDCPY